MFTDTGLDEISRRLDGIVQDKPEQGVFRARRDMFTDPELFELSRPLRRTRYFWLLLGSGALSMLLGILIMAGLPASAGVVLGTMLAIDLVSSGIALIVLGLVEARRD